MKPSGVLAAWDRLDAARRAAPQLAAPQVKNVSMNEEKKCTRPGCGKPLRKDNVKGRCSSGCLSPEAPDFQRADHVAAATSSSKPKAKPFSADDLADEKELKPAPRAAPITIERKVAAAIVDSPTAEVKLSKAQLTLQRFRTLGEALGFDPDVELATFAQGFIDRARDAVKPEQTADGESEGAQL